MTAADEHITIERILRDGFAIVEVERQAGEWIKARVVLDGDDEIVFDPDDNPEGFSAECWDPDCGCGDDLRHARAVLD